MFPLSSAEEDDRTREGSSFLKPSTPSRNESLPCFDRNSTRVVLENTSGHQAPFPPLSPIPQAEEFAQVEENEEEEPFTMPATPSRNESLPCFDRNSTRVVLENTSGHQAALPSLSSIPQAEEVAQVEENEKEGPFKMPEKSAPKKQISKKKSAIRIGKKADAVVKSVTFVNKTPTIIYPTLDEEDSDDNIRRSHRIRVKPLEYWRNQKLKYKPDVETKCMVIDGVEKGFIPERATRHRKQPTSKQTSKRKLVKREAGDSEASDSDDHSTEYKKVRKYKPNDDLSIHVGVNETMIERSEQIKKETTDFFRKSDLKWVPSKNSKGVFIAMMKKEKNLKNTKACGYIKINGGKIKDAVLSGRYSTEIIVMYGVVSIQLDDRPACIFKTMESLIVERDTMYSIKNLRYDDAVLYFYIRSD